MKNTSCLVIGLALLITGCATSPKEPAEPQETRIESQRPQPEPEKPRAESQKPHAEPLRQAQAVQAMTYEKAILAIAGDIEKIKDDFPQLAGFSADKHCYQEQLKISYGYHTHRPKGRAGWAGAVPNPNDDGVWFYIDFHDPDSMRQIHTQPVVVNRRYRDKRVMFLILEGKATKDLAGMLEGILQDHGVTTHGF